MFRRLPKLFQSSWEGQGYTGELVQTFTQAQEDLRSSTDKIQFLESSFATLKTALDVSVTEKEELRAKVNQ